MILSSEILEDKRVLVACEYSGIVRSAFSAHGWDAWSADLLNTELPGNHYLTGKEKSKTFVSIAEAMAVQWTKFFNKQQTTNK